MSYLIYNCHSKVMSNSPKMGHLPIPVWSGFRNGILQIYNLHGRKPPKKIHVPEGKLLIAKRIRGNQFANQPNRLARFSPSRKRLKTYRQERNVQHISINSLAIYHSYGNHHFHKESHLFLWAMASQTEIAQKHSKATYNLETAGWDSLDTLSANCCKLAYNSL